MSHYSLVESLWLECDPFVVGRRAEITSARKVFFIDNGVRNQIFGGFSAPEERGDHGALFENLVFSEIARSIHPQLDSVRCWRSKSGAEVDFVVQQRARLVAIEAKAGDCRGRISRSARSFVQAYQPDCLLVVSAREYPSRSLGGTEVRFVTLDAVRGTLLRRAGRLGGGPGPAQKWLDWLLFFKRPGSAATGSETAEATMTRVGRNAPCPCGSGRKYKKCCLRRDEVAPAYTQTERLAVLDRLADYRLEEPWEAVLRPCLRGRPHAGWRVA